MCQKNPNNRIQAFFDINKEIQQNKFYEIDFGYEELQSYRAFSDHLFQAISRIEHGTKYFDNIDKLQNQIEALFKKCMLEESLPDNTSLTRLFINGSYYYNKNIDFPIYVIKNFLNLLRSCSIEKKNIILSNIHTKLDAISRYKEITTDDDIPF